MTREEAIEMLKKDKEQRGKCFISDALDMAIKALEQEPKKSEIEREYLFQSLCEDFKKLRAENDNLIKRLEQEPCDDAVNRQAVKEVFPRWKFISHEAYLCSVAEIDALTPVRPQGPTGHWIITDDCEKFIAKCSECGRIEDSRMISKYTYCHCGCHMVETYESRG